MADHLVRLLLLDRISLGLSLLSSIPICLVGSWSSCFSQDSVSPEPAKVYFETHIRPILREFCLDCHGATPNPEGSLDLRLARLMANGGDSGPAIIAGDPENSTLIQKVMSGEMPPGSTRLKEEQIDLLKAWIRTGALTLSPEPEALGPGIPITEQERAYWAYQPLRPVQPPPTDDIDGVRTGLDALIAGAMPEGLSLSPDADRRTLIRRVCANLVGLPPTPEQTEHWMSLPNENWYESMVDELLESTHYGERWARHWLDAVGYADSDGSTLADAQRPWAWRYRDYVIRSFNEDKPFDQFLIEQLAGDELAGPAQGDWTDRQIELLTATGFLRMAADGTGSGDNSPEARNKTISDTLQIVGSTLLASSLHCAQCHDHRYDPISHQDYFAIRAVFEPALDWENWKTPNERLVSLTTAAERESQASIEAAAQVVAAERSGKEAEYMKQALEKELSKFEEPLKSQLKSAYETPTDQRTAEQTALLNSNPSVNITTGVLYQYLPDAAEDLKKFDARIAEIRASKPADRYVQALVEPAGHLPTTRLFHRGDHNQPTHEVSPAGLTVLATDGQAHAFPLDDLNLPTSGRRLAFAGWLTDSNNPNPLLMRALVNRIWLHHFGRGIVATPGEFGRLGAQPSHPELLDWLARQWIDNDWSLKQLHRLILSSSVYRQSSRRYPAAEAIDPENLFYWRKPVLRMDAEVLRDNVLALSGDLCREAGGPPVAVQEDETGQVKIDPGQPKRSIFATWRRSQPVAMLQAFDAPVMNINCDVRASSTVAPQALVLMNGEFILDQSAKIARLVAHSLASNEPSELPCNVTLPEPAPQVWQYGTGLIDEASRRIVDFRLLPHFSGSTWQGGQALPDHQLGWIFLSATGGHPGGPQVPAVRRWVAPEGGLLTIQSILEHPSENGDGVRGRVCCGNAGVVGTWTAKHSSVPIEIKNIPVTQGEPIDFVVDCIQHETSDSFSWPVTLKLSTDQGKVHTFETAKEFRGPPEEFSRLPDMIVAVWLKILQRPPSVSEFEAAVRLVQQQVPMLQEDPSRLPDGQTIGTQVLTNVCQILLSSNEFLYID